MSLTQGNRRRSDTPSRIRRTVETLVGAALFGLLVATLLPFLRDLVPFFALAEHFAAQIGASALACLMALLLLGRRRLALLALALTVWHGIILYPFLPLPWRQPPSAAESADGPALKVLSLNLWYRSEERALTVDYLLNSGADVIGTVETTEEWSEDLKPLQSVYPYRVSCVGVVLSCGVEIHSKLPIVESFADRVGGERPVIAWAAVDWQGRRLKIAELQLVNPLIEVRFGRHWQAEQAARATEYFSALPGDLVAMGDFNSAPWSSLQQKLRSGTGLDNSGRLAFTWPSWAAPPFRLPIDQIFTRGAVVARNVHPGPAVGSDHLPILGEVSVTEPAP